MGSGFTQQQKIGLLLRFVLIVLASGVACGRLVVSGAGCLCLFSLVFSALVTNGNIQYLISLRYLLK